MVAASSLVGETSGCGANWWEVDYDFIVYVETSVSWEVGVASGDRCSIGRMSAAISELRMTRVGVVASLWAEWSTPGVPDDKGGGAGGSRDAA